MMRSLSVPNFRRYFVGSVVSNVGTWMLRTAQAWVVLDLGGGLGVALGVVTALQFGPTMVFSVWAGALSDRYDKATILAITQSLIATTSLVLAVLDVAGLLTLLLVYVLALAGGIITAFDVPVRQSFSTELVGRENVVNAVGLNSASFNAARLVGPLVAAVVIGLVGTWVCFLLAGLSGAAIVFSLIGIDRSQLHRRPPAPGAPVGSWNAGFVAVWRSPLLLSLVGLSSLAFAAGSNSVQVVLPIIATVDFGGSALGFGFLTAALAGGGLIGALVASASAGIPRVRWVVVGALAFGVACVVTSFMPTFLSFSAGLLVVGMCFMTFVVMANTVIQLGAPPDVRGRVVAVYMMFAMGGGALGSPLLGALSDWFSPTRAITISGTAVALAALAVGLRLWLAANDGPILSDAEARMPGELDLVPEVDDLGGLIDPKAEPRPIHLPAVPPARQASCAGGGSPPAKFAG
jgi:MFS family permease